MRIFFLFTIIFAIVMAVSAQRACICTADYSPVCGASGRTYSNRCRLNCARDRFRHVGPCGGK